MRILFHNPHHRPFLGISIFARLTRNPMSKKILKHKYLIDYLCKNQRELNVYIDYQDSSFPENPKFLGRIRKLILRYEFLVKFEVYLWCIINKIKFKYIKFVSIEDINPDDILFIYANGNLDYDYKGLDSISNNGVLKFVHFTHYMTNTKTIKKNYNKLNGDLIIAENNLQNNSFFKYMFTDYKKDVYTLPFFANDRFFNKSNFNDRKCSAISIGGLVDLTVNPSSDLYKFYGERYLQPIRGEIFEKKQDLKGLIDTPVVPLRGGNQVLEGIKSIFGISKISKYYNLDMVDLFNEYQMFICSEELCGLPGIGFVEGMACGCAYIGIIDTMYTDLGLIPGKHYIGYDGTLHDLIKKIKYYQSHQNELAIIAKNGEEFVNNNLRGNIIAKRFFEDMKTIVDDYRNCGYDKDILNIKSSFVVS